MPFGSEQWMYASGGFYPYEIDQSLRFNNGDSAYLSRTPASTGNRKTWTWSGWVKPCKDLFQTLFGASDGTNTCEIYYSFPNISGGEIAFDFISNGTRSLTTTVQGYRDFAAWYHIVYALDTTQATDSDRLKIYVNGVEVFFTNVSSGNAWPGLNEEGGVNTTSAHNIGRRSNASAYFDGYMAEVNFIDGQALDPTSFGEFKSGVWIPKEYEGTYGTNGFYLDFGNSGSLGADSSGNGNNWTPNNLAATDQVPDSPTNNFGVFNPLANGGGTLSEGNLKLTGASSAWGARLSTIAVSSGKWYAEVVPTSGSATQGIMFGISNYITAPSTWIGSASTSYGYYGFDGALNTSGVVTSSWGATVADNDIVGIALDMDAGTLKLYKNNVQQGTTITGLSGLFYIGVSCYGTATANINFGQDSSFAGNKTAQGNTDANGIGDFYYAPPAGYLALCTANLPDPAIDPAQDDVPADYFNTVLWTGDGTTGRSITGVGFAPDFAWIKDRSTAYSHRLFDTIRGASKFLKSDNTDAQGSNTETLQSFDSDGFTVGNNASVNGSSESIVAWNWLADGPGASNTDGTITSTVSANQKAGFSIVSYTGNGAVTDQTVGHGLSGCEMVVVKNRSSATDGNWRVVHSELSPNYNLALNLTVTEFDVTASTHGGLGTLSTTSNTFTLKKGGVGTNNTNQSGVDYIAYCFHSVEGFSKFGSYTGNGSTDGPFVYTGFRPAFVMVKRTDAAGYNWLLWDTARDPENTFEQFLYPNLSNAEDTIADNAADSVSNGFKLRSSGASRNASGGTYIYMAFAEMPFKYSNAR